MVIGRGRKRFPVHGSRDWKQQSKNRRWPSLRRTRRFSWGALRAPVGLGISLAKHVLSNVEGTQRRKGRALSFRTKREIFPRSLAFARNDRPWACRLASWRLGESNIRIRAASTHATFAQAAQTFKDSSTRFFPDWAWKKRFASGEQP